MNEHLQQAIARGATLTPATGDDGWQEPITSHERIRQAMWRLSGILCDHADEIDEPTKEQAVELWQNINHQHYYRANFPFDVLIEMLESSVQARQRGGHFDCDETLVRVQHAVAAGDVPEEIKQKLRDDGFRVVALMCREFQAHAEHKNAQLPPGHRKKKNPADVSFPLSQRKAAALRGVTGDDKAMKSQGETTLNRLERTGIISKVSSGRAHEPGAKGDNGVKTKGKRGKNATWRYTGPDPLNVRQQATIHPTAITGPHEGTLDGQRVRIWKVTSPEAGGRWGIVDAPGVAAAIEDVIAGGRPVQVMYETRKQGNVIFSADAAP